jgi:hypothetical protein
MGYGVSFERWNYSPKQFPHVTIAEGKIHEEMDRSSGQRG